MVHYIEAIQRPLKTDFTTIILGTIFMGMHFLGHLLTVTFGSFAGIFSLLGLFVHGLGIEVARNTQKNSKVMPHFSDYVDAFFSGLMVYVIGIIYFLPALL